MQMCSSCSFHTGGLRGTELGSYINIKNPGYSEEFKGVSSSTNCFRIFVMFPTYKSVWLLVFQRLKGGQAAVASDLKRLWVRIQDFLLRESCLCTSEWAQSKAHCTVYLDTHLIPHILSHALEAQVAEIPELDWGLQNVFFLHFWWQDLFDNMLVSSYRSSPSQVIFCMMWK